MTTNDDDTPADDTPAADTPADDSLSLTDMIRSAVAAEFTTLPAYLAMYWSIKPASDGGSDYGQLARTSIMTVIQEEMLHMALASNLLNALGGTPVITVAPYLPVYPCNLLRTSRQPTGFGTAVDLMPLSSAAIDMATAIELPEWDSSGPTLGQFYDQIVALLPADDAAYGGGRQVAPWNNPGPGRVHEVATRESALQAVHEIVHQGEGRDQKTHDDGNHELAHYWRFEEVGGWITNGWIDPATDVYPVVPSPSSAKAKYSPAQQAANDHFNRAYSRMIDALEATLSGATPNVYPVAAASMRELYLLADRLRLTGPVPGTQLVPGPTFEYVSA